MPRKSPYSEEVFKEWSELCNQQDELSPEQRVAKWQGLFEKYRSDGSLDLPAADASLITSSGFFCKLGVKDYSGARELCDIFLSLPDAKLGRQRFVNIEVLMHQARRAKCLMLEGRSQEAAQQFREILEHRQNLDLANAFVHQHISTLLSYELRKKDWRLLAPIACECLEFYPDCQHLISEARSAATAESLNAVLIEAFRILLSRNAH